MTAAAWRTRCAGVIAGLGLIVASVGCGHIVILHDPLGAAEHNDLGVAYERRGEWRLAEREYRRALRIDPDFARARLNLGNVAAHHERWTEAERHYRRALAGLPEEPDAWNNLAMALMHRGRLAEAESAAVRAVALSAGSDSLYRATLGEVRAARLK